MLVIILYHITTGRVCSAHHFYMLTGSSSLLWITLCTDARLKDTHPMVKYIITLICEQNKDIRTMLADDLLFSLRSWCLLGTCSLSN